MSSRSSRQDRGLRAWGDTLRSRRAARQRRRILLVWAGLGAALLAMPAAFGSMPLLVWNASASAPIGLYRISAESHVQRGEMVVAWPPVAIRALAAQRHYLPLGVPLVKRVAAVAGDRVCALGATLFVDDTPVAVRLADDGARRPLPWWRGCGRLRRGAVLLLMTDRPDSFDGRYFGPVDETALLGRATPLWLR